MKYTVEFTGRLRGAIGVFEKHIVSVEADNPKAAILKVYDTHEHLMNVFVNSRPYWPNGEERPAKDPTCVLCEFNEEHEDH